MRRCFGDSKGLLLLCRLCKAPVLVGECAGFRRLCSQVTLYRNAMTDSSTHRLFIIGCRVAKEFAGHGGVLVCLGRQALGLSAIVDSNPLMLSGRVGRGNERGKLLFRQMLLRLVYRSRKGGQHQHRAKNRRRRTKNHRLKQMLHKSETECRPFLHSNR